MVHLDDGGNAFRGAEPQYRHRDRRRYRVAVERHNLERMAWQSQTANLRSAAIEDMEQHALAVLNPDRLAMAQHATVDGEQAVADLVTLRCRGSFLVGSLCLFLQVRHTGGGRKEIYRHVPAAHEERLKLLQCQEYFTVVSTRLMFGFDVDWPDLTAVLSRMQIGACAQMRVIEAETRWPWGKGNATHAVCRNKWRSLFGGTIHVGLKKLPVPVQLFWRVGVVVDIHNHPPAFLQAQKRTGELTIVSGSRKNTLWSHFNQPSADSDRVVRTFFGPRQPSRNGRRTRTLRHRHRGLRQAGARAEQHPPCCGAGEFDETPAGHVFGLHRWNPSGIDRHCFASS